MDSPFIATASYDHTIRYWNATTAQCQKTITHQESQVNRMAVSPDKQYLAAAGNPNVRLYDISSGHPNPVRSLEGHSGNVTAVGFNKYGSWMYTCSEDGSVKLWDVRDGGGPVQTHSHRGAGGRNGGIACPMVREVAGNSTPLTCACLHPNQGDIIYGDQDGTISMWDIVMNSVRESVAPKDCGDVAIRSIAVASDASHIIACDHEGSCFVWRCDEASNDLSVQSENTNLGGDDIAPVRQDDANTGGPLSSGEEVGGGDGRRGWNLPPQQEEEPTQSSFTSLSLLRRVNAHRAYILHCAISPDVRWLVTCSADKTSRLWDVKELNLMATLTGHKKWVWDAAFSADSAYLLTGSSDHTAILTKVATGEVVRQYTGHAKAVSAVAMHDTI